MIIKKYKSFKKSILKMFIQIPNVSEEYLPLSMAEISKKEKNWKYFICYFSWIIGYRKFVLLSYQAIATYVENHRSFKCLF